MDEFLIKKVDPKKQGKQFWSAAMNLFTSHQWIRNTLQ